MIRISGNDHVPPVFRGALGEALHARHKRAGRIDNLRRASFQFALHLRRDAVRANHRDLIGFDLLGILNRRHAFALEPLHFLRVVNQRPQRAHRRANSERVFNHFHGAFDAKTKPVFVC